MRYSDEVTALDMILFRHRKEAVSDSQTKKEVKELVIKLYEKAYGPLAGAPPHEAQTFKKLVKEL